MTMKCKNRRSCSVCKRKHPTILHYESKTENKQSVGNLSSNIESPSIQSTSDIVNQIGTGYLKSSCAMAIVLVKVKLRDKLKTIDTYAFFDTGRSVSFCTESLMRQLGGSGKFKQIKLNTMGSPLRMHTCMLDGLQVCDMDMNHIIDLRTVYTNDKMPVTDAHIPTNNELTKWPHLNGVRLPDIDSTVGLMIGNNVPDAYTPFEVATGPTCSTHATKTRLGYIDYMEFEKLINDKRENSVEDKCLNESVHFENGHYCIALPFTNKNIKFPNNESQGLQLLKGIRSKMIKNPNFKDDYVSFISNLLVKGYAEKVSE
ncbi:unnamed protein product [Mytilus coruscus]|uniref:Peptidase aspartic putative domain-containing protein n=1 Tax=Mytilus coruscus TaxID=42192 RepID=A0A6J8BZA2_MYTCO|nr:unnamed protein product [Mytilus coruscus]